MSDCMECRWGKIDYQSIHCGAPIVLPKSMEESRFPIDIADNEACKLWEQRHVESRGGNAQKGGET